MSTNGGGKNEPARERCARTLGIRTLLAAGEAEMKIFLESTSVFVAFLAIVAVNLFVLTLPVIGLLWIFGVLK
jgi:hypothetical protein